MTRDEADHLLALLDDLLATVDRALDTNETCAPGCLGPTLSGHQVLAPLIDP